MKKILKATDKVWCIANISSDHIEKLEHDLAKNVFDYIEGYVPTVKVLTKQRKNQKTFKSVPLLFNYGFFKLHVKDACNHEFLKEAKENISCLFSWVSDKSKPRLSSTPKDPHEFHKLSIIPAIAYETEIEVLRVMEQRSSLYTDGDIEELEEGTVVTLCTYPFDGLMAVLLKINKRKRTALVEIQAGAGEMEIEVSFDSLVYTLYRGSHDVENYGKEKSLSDEDKRKGY